MLTAIRTIRRNPLEFLAQTWRAHGDVAQFPIPRPATYLVSGPQDVRSLLVGSARTQSKRTLQYDNLAAVTGEGLLTANDPPWRERRRVIQPAFHHGELAAVCDHTVAALKPWVSRWDSARSPVVLDLDEAMMEISLQVVASALFGSDWRSVAAGLTKSTIVALDAVVARARNPLPPPRWLPTPGNRRLNSAVAALDVAVDSILRQRSAAGRHGVGDGDLVDLLVAGLRRTDGSVDRQAVRNELVTFLVAGHETVASALTWAWYLLADHPEVADALADEAQRVFGERAPQLPDVADLVLARAVVDETLRLYPPAWVITRKLTVDVALTDVVLPAGSLVIMSPWIVQRHPTVWERPDEFVPTRFAGVDARAQVGYLPFGLGPRICIGRDFALTEATLVLALLAQRFRFVRRSRVPITPLASVTLRPPEGLQVRVERR